MSRLIDAETLKISILRYAEKLLSHKRLPITKRVAEEVINDVCFAIDVQESVDAVPIVRCKDCKWLDYCDMQKDAFTEEREYLCCREGFPVDLNGFCSWGKKVKG